MKRCRGHALCDEVASQERVEDRLDGGDLLDDERLAEAQRELERRLEVVRVRLGELEALGAAGPEVALEPVDGTRGRVDDERVRASHDDVPVLERKRVARQALRLPLELLALVAQEAQRLEGGIVCHYEYRHLDRLVSSRRLPGQEFTSTDMSRTLHERARPALDLRAARVFGRRAEVREEGGAHERLQRKRLVLARELVHLRGPAAVLVVELADERLGRVDRLARLRELELQLRRFGRRLLELGAQVGHLRVHHTQARRQVRQLRLGLVHASAWIGLAYCTSTDEVLDEYDNK